jgi:hypothetical protein
MKAFIVEAYQKAKKTTTIPQQTGLLHKKALYWGLFTLLVFLVLNIVLGFIKIPPLYYTVFCVAILANFAFIWLKSYKDRIQDVYSVIHNWDVLPRYGKNSFMQYIHAQIMDKMLTMPLGEMTLEKVYRGIYIVSGGLLANALWQDRGFTARSFFILLLCLMLAVVVHMHISVHREWHLSGISDERVMLIAYHDALVSSYKKIVLLLSIMAVVIVLFLAWYFLGQILSQSWDNLF